LATDCQGLPDWTAVAAFTNGDFVAAGTYAVNPIANKDLPIYARRFDARGIPYGKAFQVGALTNGYATVSAAYGTDGRFAFAWPSHTRCVMVRAFQGNESSPFAPEFAANSFSVPRGNVSARYNSKNELVVVWAGAAEASKHAVYIRRFDAGLAPEGGEWKVNETAPADEWDTSLSIGPNDEALVSWNSGTTIYARLLDRNGHPMGHEFRVNQYSVGKHTMGWEACPHTLQLSNGDLVAGWAGDGASGKGVYLTVFKLMTNGGTNFQGQRSE